MKGESMKAKSWECIECGHQFNLKVGPRTLEPKCPKCKSTDIEWGGPLARILDKSIVLKAQFQERKLI